jgi:hypothetical protein
VPLPTIYGPDSWGAIQIPVLPQEDGTLAERASNDPCLYYIGSFLCAFLTTDENATAQWDIVGVAPGCPPIKSFTLGKPTDEGYSFTNESLPSLFIWRDTLDTGYLGDAIGKAESVVKMLWVFPLGEPANTRKRLPFHNALVKSMFSGVERGRTPGWIVSGETDPFALGAPLWTPDTVFGTGFQVVPNPPNGRMYNCTVSGATGGTAPAWTTTTGATFTDGTVTWQDAGTWTPQGSLFWTYAAFAKLWLEKSRPATVKITNRKNQPVQSHPAIETTWYLLEDLQFGITNRVALDPNTGFEVTTYPSQTSATWTAATSYDLNVGPMHPTVPNNFSYLCTVAGISGLTEPVWPTTPSATVVDGTCTWTCVGPVTETDDIIA